MAERRMVYLDNHATTMVDPRVVAAMLPFFSETFGNPASRQHEFGWRAEAAVEKARLQIAGLVGSVPEEVIFTSGATESINLALRGTAGAATGRSKHIVSAATEHRAVLDTLKDLEREGVHSTIVPVDRYGMVDPDDVRIALRSDTVLVSVMAANNEIGTLGPIREIAKLCRERGILFHTDATQAAGHIPLHVGESGVHLLSFNAHKMHGPKGVGALIVRTEKPAIALLSQITGGGHEKGLRSGTLNVPAIVGFGAAAELALREGLQGEAMVAMQRDLLVRLLMERLEDLSVNGHPTLRLANNASVTFHGANADAVMMRIKEVAVSAGSACSSALPGPSHVLRAIGLSREDAASTLRFGLSRHTTDDEIGFAADRVVRAVQGVRSRSLEVV
jgi:cysteine desulfurase